MKDATEHERGPWNPGLSSKLPAAARHLSTIYRPENVATTIDQVDERAAFTGLDPESLVAFCPERLIIHELLIRVTGDFSVPDGQRYADLGINFRSIVDTILKTHITPKLPDIIADFEAFKAELRQEIEAELTSGLFSEQPQSNDDEAAPGLLARWLGLGRPQKESDAPEQPVEERERLALESWRKASVFDEDAKRRRLCRALADIIGAISIRYGRVRGDLDALADLVTDRVVNDHGSAVIGKLIEPLIQRAAEMEGYRLLPLQDEPVVMNVKGASAAGKSTLRPLQRGLAEKLGIDWRDFALISPDIWRKYLLDYDSLGEFWNYAGTLTGHELQMIDQKLDRYMAEKARRSQIPHLLIDRFRFDSFAETEGGEQGARLLTRFGSTIYMFFVITPPEATVERAWKRGLEFGRFKAVDDLLDHNVEAFTGMPDLFFTWALRKDKRVHYEFLDNSVPLGERPRTVAFGWNDEMTILDIKCLINVDRYKRIDINATSPDEVYPDADQMLAVNNTDFLKRCMKLIRTINIAAPQTERLMARIEDGALTWVDRAACDEAASDPDIAAGLAVLAPADERATAPRAKATGSIDLADAHILGCHEDKSL